MAAVRNRKKGSASAKSKQPQDKPTSATSPPPPYTSGTTNLLSFLALTVLLFIGIQLVLSSSSLEQASSNYNCDAIDEAENIVQNGHVHGMLQQIAQNSNPHYEPVVLADNVIQLENLLTADESSHIIALGKKHKFQQSLIVDSAMSAGTRQDTLRTSKTLWCRAECQDDPVMQQLLKRLENLLQISQQHFEPIQLLEYEVGEFYGNHSDFAHREIYQRPGPRVLTLLFYLNDVEKGGETYFDALNITVTPKVGRAILWSNCENEDVHRRDLTAFHQALPVKAGIKYAANVWVHLRNYKEPMEQGCLQQYEERLR